LWISYVCQEWRVRTDKTDNERWYNANSPTIAADGQSLLLTVHLPRNGAACPGVEAVQYGYAPWPAAALHDGNGNPAFAFEISITSPQQSVLAPLHRNNKANIPNIVIPTGGIWDKLLGQGGQDGVRRRRLQNWLDLEPLSYIPLKLGAVTPSGWLAQQLQVEAAGMAGYLDLFYPPITYSPWITNCTMPGGCQDTNEGKLIVRKETLYIDKKLTHFLCPPSLPFMSLYLSIQVKTLVTGSKLPFLLLIYQTLLAPRHSASVFKTM
jgi:hypothetical protein